MNIYKVLWTLKYQFKILISDQYFLCPNKSNKTCKSKKEIYSKVFSRGNFFENNFYKIQVIKIVFTSICVRNWKQTFSVDFFSSLSAPKCFYVSWEGDPIFIFCIFCIFYFYRLSINILFMLKINDFLL